MKKMFLFFLILSYFVSPGHSETQGYSTPEKVMAEAKKGRYKLITGEELKREFMKSPSDLFLVDTRQDWEYHAGHIKGARLLSAVPSWWYQYSPKARWEMKKALGHDKDIKVVFY